MPRLTFIGTPPKKPATKTKGKKSLQTTLQSAFHFSVRTAVVAAAVSVEAVVLGKPQRQGEKGLVRERNAKRSSISSSSFGGKENLPEDNGSSDSTGFFQSSEAAQFFQPTESSSLGGKRKLDPIAAAASGSSKRKSAPAKVPVVKGLVPSLELAEPATTGASCYFLFSDRLFTFLFSQKSCPKSYHFLTIGQKWTKRKYAVSAKL